MKHYLLRMLKKVVPADVPFEVSALENERLGHYATNAALILAKHIQKPPLEVAESIKAKLEKIAPSSRIAKIKVAAPGFINFFLSPRFLERELKMILAGREQKGVKSQKKGTIIVEYSSPNVAKPLHVGHLRSTLIGDALANIYEFLGVRVIRWNYIGDWGTQFGKLIAAYKLWGDKQKLNAAPIETMLNLYIRFHEEMKKKPELEKQGQEEFKKLEEGDRGNRKLWQWFTSESLKEFHETYKRLGIETFDITRGESPYEKEMKPLTATLLKKGVAEASEGAVIVRLDPFNLPSALVQKSDGASLYLTRDIANLLYRIRQYKPKKIIYVVAHEQSLHFAQLFAVAKLLKRKLPMLMHVTFGMVLGSDGKRFATREGKLVPLNSVLGEAVHRSEKMVAALNPNLSKRERQNVARMVGIGAVKFFDLSRHRTSNIVFNWDQMLSLKGASAPYIQYTYARLKSIMRKAGARKYTHDPSLLTGDRERAIIFALSRFSEVVREAAERFEPNRIAEYLLRLAEKMNAFYETMPVLKADKETRAARLCLVQAGVIVMKNGLGLLGIQAPERM